MRGVPIRKTKLKMSPMKVNIMSSDSSMYTRSTMASATSTKYARINAKKSGEPNVTRPCAKPTAHDTGATKIASCSWCSMAKSNKVPNTRNMTIIVLVREQVSRSVKQWMSE